MYTRMDDGTSIMLLSWTDRPIQLQFGTLKSDERAILKTWSISVEISNDSRYPWINARASASVDMCLMDS